MGDLPKWKVLKVVKIFQSGLVVMSNLPRWKTQIFQWGEKYEDFSKWSCCNRRPAQMKNTQIFQRGEKYKDFSKWWEMQRFLKIVLL